MNVKEAFEEWCEKKRGLEPKHYKNILGKKAKTDIKSEESITCDKIED